MKSTRSMMLLVTVFFVLLATSMHAKAQQAIPAIPDGTRVHEQAAWSSDATATLLLSLGSTLIPAGAGLAILANSDQDSLGGSLLLLGALAGPSAGQYYLGEVGTGLAFTGGRALSAGLLYAGLGLSLAGAFDCFFECEGPQIDHSSEHTAGAVLMVLGGASYLAFTIWDIADSTHTAIERSQPVQSLALSPLFVPPPSASKDAPLGYGLALSGRF
jgi:hypothetical protein